jgi:ferredoxin--NADP+ reductase
MLKEKVTWVHHWSDRTFSFKTTRSSSFKFWPGEFAMIGLEADGKKILRAYSIVSPPWAEELEFLSIKMPDGELTSRLQHIKVGDEIIIAPKTTGTLRNEALLPGGELWLLATGTGLAPFMSLIRDLETLETWSKIHIVHSVRSKEDLAYNVDLAAAFKDHPQDGELHEMVANVLDYKTILTGQGEPRITEQLEKNMLTINTKEDKVMLCGNMQFNKQVAAWCEQHGMVEGSLRDAGQYVIERAFVD